MLIPSRAFGFIRSGLNGRFGVTVPNFGTGGTDGNPLDNDVDAGDEAAGVEFCPVFASQPSSGTLTVWTDGSLSLVGAADGTYVLPYSLYTFTPGGSASVEADGSPTTYTVTVGSAVPTIAPSRIESTSVVTPPTVTRIAVALVAPTRIESTAAVYAPAVSADGLAAISPARIESTVSFGTATVARQSFASVSPGRIDSTAAFGVPVVSSSGVAQIVVGRIESTAVVRAPTVVRTGSGVGADPAEVWAYVLSNGKTAEQTLLEVHAMLSAHGTAADIAAAVLAAMNSTPPGVDVKRVNGVVLQGTGVTGDSMRPA